MASGEKWLLPHLGSGFSGRINPFNSRFPTKIESFRAPEGAKNQFDLVSDLVISQATQLSPEFHKKPSQSILASTTNLLDYQPVSGPKFLPLSPVFRLKILKIPKVWRSKTFLLWCFVPCLKCQSWGLNHASYLENNLPPKQDTKNKWRQSQ